MKKFIKENGIKMASFGLSIIGFGLGVVQSIIDSKEQEKMINDAVDAKINSIIKEDSENE